MVRNALTVVSRPTLAPGGSKRATWVVARPMHFRENLRNGAPHDLLENSSKNASIQRESSGSGPATTPPSFVKQNELAMNRLVVTTEPLYPMIIYSPLLL